MYRCAYCGSVFDEPEIAEWWEDHGPGQREHWRENRCPECGSDDFNEEREDEDAEED